VAAVRVVSCPSMRAAWVCISSVVALSSCAWVRVSPDDPRIRYTGRVDRSGRFSNTGVSVAVRVDSPEVRFQLRDVPFQSPDGRREPDQYELLLDGAPAGTLAAKDPEWSATVALGPGPHTVALYKRTEPEVGQGQLLAVEVPWGGQVLSPPEPPRRRIEFIGDSLTAGFGDLGAGPKCLFMSQREDGYRAYAALVGRALDAEVHIVAWSGHGIIRNYDLSTTDTIPEMFERALPEDPATRWDFSKWTPDAVVIIGGTNDFAQPSLDIKTFEDAYFALVTRVRQRYPGAFILAAYPHISDEWPVGARHGTLSREAMDRVMQRLTQAGVTRVKLFHIDKPAPQDGQGCLWHPSIPGQQTIANGVRAVVSEALGWR
jgi:lysophospholipase L1-like esterase